MSYDDFTAKLVRENGELRTECAALRAACKSALKHADANGMQDWPVFRQLRKAVEGERG